MNTTHVSCLVMVLIGLAGCGWVQQPKGTPAAKRPPQEVDALILTRVETPRTLSYPASIEAAEQIDITARVVGLVDQVLVREGDRVAQGQELVRLVDARLQASACAAAAALAKATARLAEERAALDRRERASAGISQDELASARAQFQVATADLAQAQAELLARMIDVQDAVIRAPAEGIIDTRTVRPGQQLTAGTRVATMIQRLPLYVRAAVVESEAVRLRPGMLACATAGSASASGPVVHVGLRADPATRMADVVVRLDSDPGWLAGSFVRLDIELSRGPSPWIPLGVVRSGERGSSVWILDRSEAALRVREQPIVLGLQDNAGQVEIRSGLAAGTEIVVAGMDGLWAGREVRLRGATAAAPAR